MSAENKVKTDSTSKARNDSQPTSKKTSDKTPTITTRTQFNESIYIETEFLPSSSQLANSNYNFEVSHSRLTE